MGIFDEILGSLGKSSLGDELNRIAINHIASSTPARPRAYSLWSPVPASDMGTPGDPYYSGPVNSYTSWPGLTDRRYSSRHLPPATDDYLAGLTASPADLQALFKREGAMRKDRSSVLFCFFAQWFTDSVLRVNPADRRQNTSNHDVDLCQIYGLTEETAHILRSKEGGRLRCRTGADGGAYPDYLYEQTGEGTALQLKMEYAKLPYAGQLDAVFNKVDVERRRKAYATGLERGNSTIGYAAISTLFLREHNRICADLAAQHTGWDDERLFQTARMINIVLLMKVVVEDYINHIAGRRIFKLDPTFAENRNWYRTNWIAIEFDLLYRWHGLVPTELTANGGTYPAADYRNNNALLESLGLHGIFNATSSQAAGRIGLFNTPDFLLPAELASLKMSRDFRLRPYNDYRERFGLDRLERFEQLTSDTKARERIAACYGNNIDKVEFLVGLLAEDHHGDALFGDLLNTMVAYDAFTQIFTNPLLSRNVYNEDTFTRYGLDLIARTTSIDDIAKRNVAQPCRARLGVPAA
jgi:prostaglandin-endoperoxide synthase 2